MSRRLLIIIFTLVFSGLFTFAVFVTAQEAPICGDGSTQEPEKCDDGIGGVATDTQNCTAQCGAKMLGWAWADTFGWLSLNSQNCDVLPPDAPTDACAEQQSTYYVQVTADNQVIGWAWSDNVGWVCFGATCSSYGVPPFGTATAVLEVDEEENPRVRGWAYIVALGNDGWISLDCQNENGCTTSNYQTRAGKNTFGAEERYTLTGWGWNPVAGWLSFNPAFTGVPPWLQTQYGDIYARGGFSGQQPPGYNATYRILSGGAIENFRSARDGNFWVSPNFGPINFPTPETRYSNVLGSLDINSLTCQFGSDGTCVNRLGNTVVDLQRQPLSSQQLLDGKVYYSAGDLTINSSVEFINGSGFENAAGTIVVNGNLTIGADVFYDRSNSLQRFRNVASVAWIVKGDVYISPNVGELAGNYIIIGNGQQCSESGVVAGCGQIFTCSGSGDCSSKRLSIFGLVMARKFYLERTFTEQVGPASQGSEVVIYDGRLLANTPPGLGDFAKALPLWRSEIFSR
jgi:hypothetical protein